MLSDQQEAFARAIASGCDTAAAAALAYPEASRPSQARQARRLIRMGKIQERIAGLTCSSASAAAPLPVTAFNHASGADSVPPADVSDLVCVAFDASQPDLLRLAALRRLDAALARAARDAPRGQFTASLTIALTVRVPPGR